MRSWIWGLILLAAATAGFLLVRDLGRVAEPPVVAEPILQRETGLPMRAVLLFFPAEERFGFVTEERVVADPGEPEALVESIVAELFAGPAAGVSPWPPGAAIRSVYRTGREGIVYLDLVPDLLVDWPQGDGLEWAALGSIVRSVTENLPEIRAVQILVGGRTVVDPPGSIPLDLPLEPDWFATAAEEVVR